jgi:predicted sugar kinase
MTEVGQANRSSMRHSPRENIAQTKYKTKHGSALAINERLNDWVGFAGAFQRMTAIPKAIARIATRSWNLEDHNDSRVRAKEFAMAKVIEFYIPQNFRRTTKWVPEVQRGKILELRPQTKRSA